MGYDIGPRIGITGESEFNSAIRRINSEMKTLNTEMQKVTSAYDANDRSAEKLKEQSQVLAQQMGNQKEKLQILLQQYDKQKTKLDELEKALKDATEQYGANSKEAAKAQIAYENQVGTLGKVSTGINVVTTNVNKMNRELANIQGERLRQLSDEAKEAGTQLEGAGRKMMLLSAAITAGAAYAAKAAIDYETAFAGVTKTVNGTDGQLAKISDEIRTMSKEIPASATAIASVAEQAGQLGIATEDISSFTKVMIDLGESTNLSANVAADSLARFANITGLDPSNYERLGSTIVDLGNNAATTESEIVAMSTRLAATGDLVGLTEPQILALATTLSSLGIEAEAGGSAISRVLKEFEVMVATGSESLKDFAAVAGMTAEQFSTIWKNDPTKGLAAFIDGLGKIKQTGGSTVAVLEELGITEIRMSNAVAAMATANGLLTENLDRANQAWNENTALATEAEKRYATTESQMQIAKNTLQDVAITMGSEFLPMIINGTEKIGEFGEWFAKLDGQQKESIVQILAITAALGPMLSITGKASTAFGVVAARAAEIQVKMAASTAATAGQAVANTAVATTSATAAISMRAFTAALMANPATLIATAVAGLASVIAGSYISSALMGADATEQMTSSLKDLRKEYEETIATISSETSEKITNISAAESMMESFQKLNEVVGKTPGELAQLEVYAAKINELLGQQVLVLNGTRDAYVSTSGSVEQYIEKMREQAELEGMIAEQTATAQNIESIRMAIQEREKQIAVYQVEIDKLSEMKDLTGMTASEINGLKTEQQGLREEMEKLNADIEKQNSEYDKLQGEVDKASEAFDNSYNALSNLSAATRDVIDSTNLACQAFDEYTKTGEVSTEMTNRLIEAGYLSADAIDTETGAAQINGKAMLETAMAKLTEREATLEAAKASITAKLNEEAQAATNATGAFFALAKAMSLQNMASMLSTAAIEKEQESIAQSKAAIVSRLNSISAGTAATNASTKATKGNSKEVDKNVEAFKKARKEIEYERDMGVISEKEFYGKLEKLQSQYLKESSDEWKNVNVEIYKWTENQSEETQKKLQESYEEINEALAESYSKGVVSLKDFINASKRARDDYLPKNTEVWKNATKDIYDEITSLYDEIISKQEEMAGKLSNYSELMDEDGNLTDLQDQIDAIEQYDKALTKLKEEGIGEGLMSEIVSMDIDDALTYMDKLLEKSGSGLKAYNDEWETVQREADKVAQKYYNTQLDELDKNYLTPLRKQLAILETDSYSTGQKVAENINKGVLGKEAPALETPTANKKNDELEKSLKSWDEDSKTIRGEMQSYVAMLLEEMKELEPDAYDIGVNSMNGLADGIRERKSHVVNTMIDVVRAAISAAKDELDIHSPSRVFDEMGNFSVDGYIGPWEKRASEVEDSIRSTLRAGADVARQQIVNSSRSETVQEGDMIFQIANVNNGSDRDVYDLMRVGEFMRSQRVLGKGGQK